VTAKIDRLLIGDNPFNGVNHRSRERSRGGAGMLSDEIVNVIKTALDNGAQGLVFSVTPKMLSVLKYMKENGWNRELHLYPIVPDVLSLVNESAELGMVGLLSRFLDGLSVQGKFKLMVKGGLAAFSFSPVELIKTYLNAETDRIYAAMPHGAEARAIFLHEIVADALVGLRLSKVLQEYCKHVHSKLGVVPGLVTRNFPRLVEFLKFSAVPLNSVVVMAPFNAVGFQMNPSKEICEEILDKECRLGLNVVAMSILSAGRLSLKQATDYIMKLPSQVSCVIGTSSESHSKETFEQLSRYLR